MSRARDEAFETLATVCDMDWQRLTPNERGKLNQALAQIRSVEIQEEHLPAMIRSRAQAFHHCYPEIPTTPQAIVNHWSSIEARARGLSAQVNRRSRVECETCHGDRWIPAGVDERGYDQSRPCPTCTTPPDDRPRADSSDLDRPVPGGGAGGRADHHARALSVTCALCGEEIYEQEQRHMWAQEITWQPVKVYRRGGGIHDRGRGWKRTGALAHDRCVDALAKGHLNQRDLFTQADQPGLFP